MLRETILLYLLLISSGSMVAQESGGILETPVEVQELYDRAFLSRDLEELISLYTEDAVLVWPDGNIYKGHSEIRSIYENVFEYIPAQIRLETAYRVQEDELLHRVTRMWNEGSGEKLVPFSAETFIIRDGGIRYHTISDYNPEMDLAAPVALNAPEDWGLQTSSLPRDFAPGLYEGIADYAFAPGMFEPGEEDYFTYVMVLWTPLETDISEQQLERDLETYFDGLASVAVPGINENNAASKVVQLFDSLSTRLSVPQDSLRADVELNATNGEDDRWEKVYNGNIRFYEGMVGHRPVELQAKLRLAQCPVAGYRVIFLEASPQPYLNELWDQMDVMADQWQCPEEKED